MEQAENQSDAVSRKRKTILIVEDNEDIGFLFVMAFQAEAGYHLFLVKDATQALEAIKMIIPDLFLLDYGLPGMNGLDLYDWLQDQDDFKHIPVLLVSASPPAQEAEKRHLAFLEKPFELTDLLEKVEELLVR